MTRNHQILYLAISGGKGQWLDILFLASARVFSCAIIIHHHSFSYLNDRKVSAQIAIWIAGIDATHIVLGQNMEWLLKKVYCRSNVMQIGNAGFIEMPIYSSSSASEILTIGFLSNLSAEKGVWRFIDTCRALTLSGKSFRALIAGPPGNCAIVKMLDQAMLEMTEIEYLGPISGNTKQNFFDSIDVLLFPTAYRNEAEPLVILEALANAVPCISVDRGEIAVVLCEGSGSYIVPIEEFAQQSASLLSRELGIANKRLAASRAARQRFETLHAKSISSLDKLLRSLPSM